MSINQLYHSKSKVKAENLSLAQRHSVKNTLKFIEEAEDKLNHATYWAKLSPDSKTVEILDDMRAKCNKILGVSL